MSAGTRNDQATGDRSFAWIAKPAAASGPSPLPSNYLSIEQSMDAFRGAMRRLAGAVNLVTTRTAESQRLGLTATAVCSLTANPPRLLACVNLSGRSYQAIASSRCMAINVLATQHRALALAFSRKEVDPFEQDYQWTLAATGAPLLADALASFDCEVEQMMVTTTHAIVIGDVRHISYGHGGSPLLYVDGTFSTCQSLAAL